MRTQSCTLTDNDAAKRWLIVGNGRGMSVEVLEGENSFLRAERCAASKILGRASTLTSSDLPMSTRPNHMQLRGVAFSAYPQGLEMPWPTPMRDVMQNPDGGDFTWCRLHYIFGLPDPRTFPATAVEFTDGERDLIERFVAHAKSLASTTLLTSTDQVTVNIDHSKALIEVETDLSASDVTTGFMAMVRQCLSHEDEACFAKVKKILERRLHDAGQTEALAILKQWNQAHSALMKTSSEELIQLKMIEEGRMPARVQPPGGPFMSAILKPPASPVEMLNVAWYGSQLHWGKYRKKFRAIQANPLQRGLWEIGSRQAAIDFGNFYIGFALVLERALEGDAPATATA